MSEQRCENCCYSRNDGEGFRCLKNPPTAIVIYHPTEAYDDESRYHIVGAWPDVAPTDWCGSYESEEQENQPRGLIPLV